MSSDEPLTRDRYRDLVRSADGDPGERPAPWYKERPAELIAQTASLSLAERGLLATMRWACWLKGSLPVDSARIGTELAVNPRTIRAHLTHGVMRNFCEIRDESTGQRRLVCLELEQQRERLIAMRAAQSMGGVKGAAIRYGRVKPGTKPSQQARLTQDAARSEEVGLTQESPLTSRSRSSSLEEEKTKPLNPSDEENDMPDETRKQEQQPQPGGNDYEPELTNWHRREAARLGIERLPDEPAWQFAGRISRAFLQRSATGTA